MSEVERLAREPVRIGGRGRGDDRGDARIRGPREDGPDRAHRVPHHRADRHLRAGHQRLERRGRIEPELPGAQRQRLGGIGAVATDIDGQAVEPGGVEEQRVRERPVARRLPAVDERHARTRLPAAGRDEPRRQVHVAGADRGRLERQAEVRRGDLRRVLARVPGSGAVGERESVGQAERRRGDGRREPGSTDESHGPRGRHGAPACQARASGGGGRYTERRGETRSARRPGRRARRRPVPDQGRLAAAGAIEPSGPDRRRPDGRPGRDAADGRDQRRLRGADPRGGGGPPGTGRRARRLRGRARAAPRRAATAAADPAGDAPPGHDRDIPAAQPGDKTRRRRGRAGRRSRCAGAPRHGTRRPAAAARRACPGRATARVHADRPARARPAPRFPPARSRRSSTRLAST